MPKTIFQRKNDNCETNLVSAVLKKYKKTSGLTDSDIAERLSIGRPTVNIKLNQPAGCWELEELNAFCKILKCPLNEVFTAYEAIVDGR